ncbi:MFS transporter [Alicyclobacillus fastidiosus]|uniref:MFS transporter n=1 Tax=Alicyclobacillus fastidiosus TaxID=392011 RepID=A0ABY6ZFF1_9BACL|nr:MFS transporter [Alicyclobacillus fastidiosus]WAH41629.1 MFS transporter [Alicyclobacillus fastidiosus]GMA63297.1 putative MFS-type transporter YfnC [Alicyclobacillus fastidiosus]
MTERGSVPARSGLNRGVVWSLGGSHLLNDLVTTGVVPALSPLYMSTYHLNYTQTSLVVLCSYLTSSISQPLFGALTDKYPRAWLLPLGLFLSTLCLTLTGVAPNFAWLLLLISISGLGSGAFHPEAARGTQLASGNARGRAQAIFQVGGNSGQALGQLMMPLFLLSLGVHGLLWFAVAVGLGLILTGRLYPWYRGSLREHGRRMREAKGDNRVGAVVLLVIVVIVRSWCQIGISVFLPFYYRHQFGMSYNLADSFTFIFLAAGAVGTFIGGTLADKMPKQRILLYSMLCSIPFALLLPFLHGAAALFILIPFGFFILSSFAVTVVYCQYLLPRNISLASGLTIGFGVGAGGIGATFFGALSDAVGLKIVFYVLMFLPILGSLLSFFLPNDARDVASS